jgi:hypothetical protein
MTRMKIVMALFVFGALAVALPVSAAGTQEFRAELHDNLVCPGVDLCGRGELQGFGTVTTTLTFTSAGPGPDNCTALTADRVLTLDSDGSTLRLSVEGVLCPQGNSGGQAAPVGSGTFAVVGGTGQFVGATGSGLLSVQATGKPGPTDTAHYNGILTLR